MKLTNEDIILIANTLRQKAQTCSDLGKHNYGRPAYRHGLRQLALRYERLAKAFSEHTIVTLENK